MFDNRLYVLTRKDLSESLSLSYQAVQGAHAVAQFAIENPADNRVWNNNYLIFLEVDNLEHLQFWEWKLDQLDVVMSKWYEPDLNNELTAIAVYPADRNNGIFSSLKLMGA